MLPSSIIQMQERVLLFSCMAEKDETGVSVLDKVLHKLVKSRYGTRTCGRIDHLGIVDAQSVQNADRGRKRYDAEKKYLESTAHVV